MFLPITETLFQGGEYSVRGYDIRSIGPRDQNGLVLGGNKSLLFNAEYLITIAGPVRLVLFYDAGQVRAQGVPFGMKEDITADGVPVGADLVDPFATVMLTDPNAPGPEVQRCRPDQRLQDLDRRGNPILHAGAERAIPADLRDESVAGRRLDNNLQPAKEFTFKFAVGSTF